MIIAGSFSTGHKARIYFLSHGVLKGRLNGIVWRRLNEATRQYTPAMAFVFEFALHFTYRYTYTRMHVLFQMIL